ncbi:type II toxin-antitoxin system Phd/YefM family antitoxin [Marinobacter sp. LN3S78]|uniref:type II toxin-antitoxin system Phd/YefM family antitoxin n=1 Tax=Marinobacter sp. LN3S78 TaxID=3382300 RepID=UPI00387B761A
MQTLSAPKVRQNLHRLLDALASGEEFVITRCGKPIARLTEDLPQSVIFHDR